MIKSYASFKGKETSAPSLKLQHLHDVAKTVLGPKVEFRPTDTVYIANGKAHFEVIPHTGVTLKQLEQFSKAVKAPGTNHLKVEDVVVKNVGGKPCLLVTLERKS